MFTQSSETYDLKLDQKRIFLQDLSSSCIHGVLHVNLPQRSSFRGIRVKLLEVLSVPRDNFLIQNDRQSTSMVSEQSIGSSKGLSSFQLPAGNYEFPFSIELPRRMLETVTTQRHMYHTYHVEAILERRFRGNSTISQPIRIYNNPDLSAYRLSSTPIVEGLSNQDIQYCLSLPDSNIPFASEFPVKCFFSPLSKHLKLETITLSVLEKHTLQVDATAAESSLHNISKITTSSTSTIFQSEHTSFNQTDVTLTTDGDIPPAEWSISLPVQLPGSFDLASQSVSSRSVNVSHFVVVKAQFRDTEKDTTITIEESIPFSVYMTPVVIADNGAIRRQYIEGFKAYECAPPAYGHHRCDAIPPEWVEYLRQLRDSRHQHFHDQETEVPCGSTFQGSLDTEPPAYRFCRT